MPGASLTIGDVYDLAAAIRKELAAGAAGAAVIQGTDTLEEIRVPARPAAHGGRARRRDGGDAQPRHGRARRAGRRPGGAAGGGQPADPRPRLRAGVRRAARFARKTDATSVTAFTSPSAGPIGRIVEGQVRLLTRPVGRFTVPAADPPRQVRTGLIMLALGDDGELLRAAGGRFDGLVVAAFGAGHVPAVTVPVLAALAAIPVVFASRTGAGSVLAATYGFAGPSRTCSAGA